MKKRYYLLLLIMLVFPFSYGALTYKLGDVTTSNDSNVVYVKIFTAEDELNAGNALETESISCSITNKLDCKIEATNRNTLNGDHIKGEQPFGSNEEVGRVVITNDSFDEVKGATLTVNADKAYTKSVDVAGKDVPLSDDTKLKTLKVNVGEISPAFSPDTTSYTIYGINDTNRRITFDYTCTQCSVKFEGGVSVKDNVVELEVGENTVKAIVTAQNGKDNSTYTFKVIRGASTFNSSKLKSLVVGQYELDPKFDKDTKEYTVKIPKKISNIENLLDFATEDSAATTKVEGANQLDNDENEVKITVTAQDGTTTVYVLKVVKEDEVQAVIDVIGYKDNKVTFIDTEGASTTLSVDDFKKEYPDEWTKIENGEYKFDEEGNIIRESASDDKTENKETKKKNSFPWIVVILIVLAIAVIAVAGYFIFRDPEKAKNKKGKKDAKEEDKEELTDEQKEELHDIDSYNEEARLIAEDNLRSEDKENIMEDEEVEEDIGEEVVDEEPTKEEIVKEETIDDYVDDEKSATMDIDEALSDLMNTKEYNFKDK